MASFSFEDFEKACEELFNPDTEGYEFFTESHGVKIYRQYSEETGLYRYKVYGVLDGVEPDVCAEVYADLDYRKMWDSFVKELHMMEEVGKIYWQVNFPWPMWNRDYVFSREIKQLTSREQPVWVVIAEGADNIIPEKKGVVRVHGYIQTAALASDGKGGTRAYMKYFDNPGGNIPTWVINWAAAKGKHASSLCDKAECLMWALYKLTLHRMRKPPRVPSN